MHDRLDDIIAGRKAKHDKLRGLGIDPYPSLTKRTHTNAQALEQFDSLQSQQIILVGRVRSLRDMGKIIFAHIEDGTARIQVLVKEENIGSEQFASFTDLIDLGDFVEFTGSLFTTKTGEKTLEAKSFTVLAKALRPLPSEHFGIEDIEMRLRKRYLDILLNPEVKELFIKKNKFWSSMRQFLVEQGFLEVEMPILEGVPGGAEAAPFITHHNALDRDFYLRISLELPLKKMLVAGFEKVFEIGRIFRNEGISTEHLQDYTQMEFYWAYGDFEKLMQFIEKMYQHVIQSTFGTLTIESRGQAVDWSGTWERVSYVDLFKKHTGLDLLECSDADLKAHADKEGITYEDFAQRGRIIDLIFKKIRKNLPSGKPIFLIDQPLELEPLAKRDPKNPKVVQRMQIIAYGTELGKGFGELNDPIDQRVRFEAQAKLREAGDDEAQMMDEGYVEAMEYGMPPAAGFGLSERLFSVLADKSVRETQIFPLMKAEHNEPKSQVSALSVSQPASGRLPSRDEAMALLRQEVHTENLIKHMLATEAFMRGLARKFNQDEDKWGIAGLLHDLDWDKTKDDPSKHSLVAFEMLTSMGIDSEVAQAIKIHNYMHNFKPDTLLDKALYAGETYTGFLIACALVTPDKKLASVKVDSALKKFKTKSFAAGANRDVMLTSDALLGMSTEEMLKLCLEEMVKISDQLGL